ncbi:MAG: hypothetical protein MUO34_03710 [Ignavibacteriaceae bacterium]|nr:hypothetical protein [Ignavibacteriaceae bacterium]
MKTINLKAKSSSGDHYQVVFEIDDVIKVTCNCKAGIFSKLCKHKTGIISGDRNLLYDLTEEPLLDELMMIMRRSGYNILSKELIDAQKDVETAKKQVNKVKHKIEQALQKGIPMTIDN